MPIATTEAVRPRCWTPPKTATTPTRPSNITSITTINAALKAFADAKSDGIHSDVHRRRAVRLRLEQQRRRARLHRARRGRPPAGRAIRHSHRPAHRPLPAGESGRLPQRPLIEATAKRRAGGQGNLFQRPHARCLHFAARGKHGYLNKSTSSCAPKTKSSSKSRPALSAVKRTARPEPRTCRREETLHHTRGYAYRLREP